MEHFINEGIFLAPKSYYLDTKDSGFIMLHKGLAKQHVNVEWFQSQYGNLSRTEEFTVERLFNIDWKSLNIGKINYQVSLGLKLGSKRNPVYDDNNRWVDTQPKYVIDYGGQESTILQFDKMYLQDEIKKLEETRKR